jgi:acyl-coenzyme A synthetase/AMP-(fatty) acid ligase/acyl carrier protein
LGSEGLRNALQQTRNFSLVKITPAHLQLLSQQISPQDAHGSARAFVVGGEELRTEHIVFWHKHARSIELINEYGPTETTVGCCVYRVPSDKIQTGAIPIGRPIANTQVYILDAYRNPVPIGVIGEIYIGGDGVARGYLNRPELTAERFIFHSLDGEPAQRLYRTGDLARYLADGNIEFIGRADNQVKIRGFRIELGEIEAVLAQHPAIQQAVVLARTDTPADLRLVAYTVNANGYSPSARDLLSFLRRKLPDYMVPSAFVLLESFPLTANGKIDRKALPPPDRNSADMARHYVAPRNTTERIVAGIWAEILGRKRIGIHDNFFDLGGHSLKATQVISRLRKAFRSEIPLRHLFEFPTIAELAAVIDSLEKNTADENKLDRGFVGGRGAKTSG